MLKIKENFMGRVLQSMQLLRKNIISLTLPLILCNLLFIVIIPAVLMQVISFDQMLSGDISQKIGIYISFAGALGGIYFLAYLILLIPIQISIIKTIKDILYQREVDTRKNIHYGFKNIGNIFKTYWYIFSYVYLIPALLFIVGGFIFILGMLNSISLLNILGGIIAGLSLIVFIVFAIYRGLKSKFGIIAAIDSETFTKENLHNSISNTDNLWWRVFGNFLGIGIIAGIISYTFKIIGSVFTTFSYDWEAIIIDIQSQDINIQDIVQEFTQFNTIGFINKIVQMGLGAALGVFIIIFSYLLFKSLEGGNNSQKNHNIKIEKAEEL